MVLCSSRTNAIRNAGVFGAFVWLPNFALSFELMDIHLFAGFVFFSSINFFSSVFFFHALFIQ